jgi:putative transposase
MSRSGDVYDNAVMEAFFSRVKIELGDRFESADQAKRAVFEYLETFYNRRRCHWTIGYVSPAVFEQRALSAGTRGPCARI